ncbi:MAG: DNA mismatch repair endonuclease MutL [Sarcina sp.]
MTRIQLLDEHTSNQIAAGEVVEKPSSVVKELLENSIDASSKNITIEIEDGGITLIRIIDDGVGILNTDVKLAFMPHATSKIKCVEDIFNINTLGFRGEALPSIAAVSKVNLKSKTINDTTGWEVNIEAGNITIDKEVGTNIGTIIEVRDLFYNVPARRKFLKSPSREASIINDLVSRIALANPQISIKLFNNGKKVIHTFGTGELLDSIRSIYGKTTSDDVLYFENASDTVTIHGYIGKDSLARKSRNNQTIFVNKRYIKNRTISVAVENAYKSFNTGDKYPFFILFIDIYPEYVDVNVHPTKSEIKFRNEKEVFSTVFKGIHNVLGDFVRSQFSATTGQFLNNTEFEEDKSQQVSFEKRLQELNEMELKLKNTEELYKTKVDLPLDVKNNFYKEHSESNTSQTENSILNENKFDTVYKHSESFPRNHISEKNSNIKGQFEKIVQENNDSDMVPYAGYTKNIAQEAKFPILDIIGQYNKTYIIAQKEGTLYLIDQHAAHERLLFEKYLKSIEEHTLVVQPLIVPVVLELSLNDYGYYEENKDIFTMAGFKVEDFGMSSVKLSEVPYFIGKIDAKEFFIKILDNLKNLGSGKTIEVKYNKIANLACKAAVKANDLLSEDEMKKLLYDLRFLDDPFHCPHGRPTIIKFSNYDIDKMFKRIV